MSEQTKTSYKSVKIYSDNSPYLHVDNLKGRNFVFKIRNVYKKIFNDKYKKGDVEKIVVDFIGPNEKPLLIINKTQAEDLEEISGSEYIDDWVGMEVQLAPGKTPNNLPTIKLSYPPGSQITNGKIDVSMGEYVSRAKELANISMSDAAELAKSLDIEMDSKNSFKKPYDLLPYFKACYDIKVGFTTAIDELWGAHLDQEKALQNVLSLKHLDPT